MVVVVYTEPSICGFKVNEMCAVTEINAECSVGQKNWEKVLHAFC